jgi:hypothetical protein
MSRRKLSFSKAVTSLTVVDFRERKISVLAVVAGEELTQDYTFLPQQPEQLDHFRYPRPPVITGQGDPGDAANPKL